MDSLEPVRVLLAAVLDTVEHQGAPDWTGSVPEAEWISP